MDFSIPLNNAWVHKLKQQNIVYFFQGGTQPTVLLSTLPSIRLFFFLFLCLLMDMIDKKRHKAERGEMKRSKRPSDAGFKPGPASARTVASIHGAPAQPTTTLPTIPSCLSFKKKFPIHGANQSGLISFFVHVWLLFTVVCCCLKSVVAPKYFFWFNYGGANPYSGGAQINAIISIWIYIQ